jgi:predicted kinase
MAAHKRNLIIDNPNLDTNTVTPFLELADKYGYQVEFQDFNIGLEELLRRDQTRDKPVSAAVIQTYYDMYLIDGLLPPAPTLVH